MDLRDKLKFWIMLSNYVDMIVRGTSPLSLPDAIANSLSYVKAFGGTEQRNLPDGYIERQFIYMMDGSYLLTDIVPTYDCKIEMDFQTLTIVSSARTYLGCRDTSGSNDGLRVAHISSGNFRIYGFGTYTDSATAVQSNTRYKFVWNNKQATITTGGTTVFDNTFAAEGTNQTAVAINGWNTAGTVDANSEGIYLYSFKVWDNQGNLIADYVPAVQKGTVPVVGFYDTVSKTFKTATAGTFAAGGEAVPTPDAPMDIVSNNGVLKLSPNILQGEWFLNQSRTSAGGALYDLSGAVASDIFPVQSNTTYTVCYDGVANAARWYEYDANKSYITGSYVSNSETITTSSNTKYISVSFAGSQLTDAVTQEKYKLCSANKGDAALPFVPYGEIYADGTVETINVHSKNLFNKATISKYTLLNTSTGETMPQEDEWSWCSDFIPVSSSTTYYFKSGANWPVRVFEYAENKSYLSRNYTVRDSSFAVGSTCKFIRFHIGNNAGGQAMYEGETMISLGSTATEYAPYYDGGTATAEMLLKVGDYQDVQSIIDGVVTRKVGIKVLDGTENWYCPPTNKFSIYLANGRAEDNQNSAYCSHFAYVKSATFPTTDMCFSLNRSGVQCRFSLYYTAYTSADDFKQYLSDQYAAGTPVTIIYPLAQAVTEQVAPQVLNVQTGDNILEITQASLSNLELEAEYQKSV